MYVMLYRIKLDLTFHLKNVLPGAIEYNLFRYIGSFPMSYTQEFENKAETNTKQAGFNWN